MSRANRPRPKTNRSAGVEASRDCKIILNAALSRSGIVRSNTCD